MALLPVDEALSRVLEDAKPGPTEIVSLAAAGGRVLAEDVVAARDQPPFPASAMDGYAVRAADICNIPARLKMIGEAAAGRRFSGEVRSGEAVRIFTGAPLPKGADTVLIQENARRHEDGTIEVLDATDRGRHIRRAGLDFARGKTVLSAGRELDAAALSLAASANQPTLRVHPTPLVAILATGDELVPVGAEPGPDQIVSSNGFGIAEIVRRAGGLALDLGIAPDREHAIADALQSAQRAGAAVIVTIGGASVGDHDLIGKVAADLGMERAFYKLAMRPGKPLMAGRIGSAAMLGLPGNPVSAVVCAKLFMQPLIRAMQGLPPGPEPLQATLARDLPPEGDRQHYLRARLSPRDGLPAIEPFADQDSARLWLLAEADALLIRPAHDPARRAGERMGYLPL